MSIRSDRKKAVYGHVCCPALLMPRDTMNHGIEQVRMFEVAKVYLAGDKLPLEKTCLSILADTDFLTLKGIVESLLLNLGIFSRCEWSVFSEPRLFVDERAARIQLGDMTIGYIGEASKELGFKTSPCMVELDIDLLVESSNVNKIQCLVTISTHLRDLAIIVDEEVTWSSIEKMHYGYTGFTLKGK